jgi:hypothetical protein
VRLKKRFEIRKAIFDREGESLGIKIKQNDSVEGSIFSA